MILIIMIISAIPFFLLGIFMRKGKGLMLLAGYNTMPKAERDKLDKRMLSKAAGNLMLRIALILMLFGASLYLEINWASMVFLVLLIADPFIFAFKMSREMPKTKASKGGMIASGVITIVVLIGVGFLFYKGEKDPTIRVLEYEIQIESMYGFRQDLDDITSVSLIEKSMKDIGIGYRTNGYGGFGNTLKGHFNSGNGGSILLFVNSASSPTIWIEREKEKDVYISFKDSEKTISLYQELFSAISQERKN